MPFFITLWPLYYPVLFYFTTKRILLNNYSLDPSKSGPRKRNLKKFAYPSRSFRSIDFSMVSFRQAQFGPLPDANRLPTRSMID